jgi:tetratricopeptide (TPR) repeat protein
VDNVKVFSAPSTPDQPQIAMTYDNGARHSPFGFTADAGTSLGDLYPPYANTPRVFRSPSTEDNPSFVVNTPSEIAKRKAEAEQPDLRQYDIGDLLVVQEQTTAEAYVDRAKADFNNFDYDKSMKNIAEALKRQPDNASALKMKAEVLALQGKELAPPIYGENIKHQEQAVTDEVVSQINLAVQRGRGAQAAED